MENKTEKKNSIKNLKITYNFQTRLIFNKYIVCFSILSSKRKLTINSFKFTYKLKICDVAIS